MRMQQAMCTVQLRMTAWLKSKNEDKIKLKSPLICCRSLLSYTRLNRRLVPFRKLTGYVVLCTSFPPVPVKFGCSLRPGPLNALYHSQSSQSSNVAAPRTSQCGRKRPVTKFSSWQIPVFILRPLCFLTH